MKTRCSTPYCFRKSTDFMEISLEYNELIGEKSIKFPYCTKHAKVFKEIVDSHELVITSRNKFKLRRKKLTKESDDE